MSGRISVYGFPFVGKLVFFPVLIAVSSFLFVPVQPLHRDKEAFNDDWNEFNDLRYSANKFRPSTPHPTRLLGRISVRFPVRRPCTATMEAFRSLSGTSDGTAALTTNVKGVLNQYPRGLGATSMARWPEGRDQGTQFFIFEGKGIEIQRIRIFISKRARLHETLKYSGGLTHRSVNGACTG
ncbi:hypothetical protein C8R46DRAFT_1030689 [Mycena filopes]|nr:hypothetical protein C8R46DRAFT_1030689 [Mycena filopes]